MDIGFTVYALEKTPANNPERDFQQRVVLWADYFYLPGDLLRGRESINNLSGPVGIVSAISQAASYGLTPTCWNCWS